MRKLTTILLAALSILAVSCKHDEPEQKPEEPQAPVIESAQLRGVNGELEVIVGSPVAFKAKVSVTGSELATFSVEIKNGEDVLASCSKSLSGKSAEIDEVFDLSLSIADVPTFIYPRVEIRVTNTDKMATELTLAESDNVKISSPSYADILYIVDSNNAVYQLSKVNANGFYRTTADLAEVGTSYKVCSEVDGTTPKGDIWGPFDTPVVKNDADEAYPLVWLGFDAATKEATYMIDAGIVLDLKNMDNGHGNTKVYWSQKLVKNSLVKFLNYGDGMQLQADRWDNVDGNTARYTGATGIRFEVFFQKDLSWLVVKHQYCEAGAVWITGENGSVPLSPYDAYPLSWFGDFDWHSAVSCVQLTDTKWQCLMYLKENFAIKAYDYWAWGNELLWTSSTPDTFQVSPMEMNEETGTLEGNYGSAGPAFKEGFWLLTFDKATNEASLVRWTGTIPDPVANGEGEPVDPSLREGYFLVDENNAVYDMTATTAGVFATSANLSDAGNNLRIVSKVNGEGPVADAIVYAEFTKDPVYAEFTRTPWKICYSTLKNEYFYQEGVWNNKGTGADEVLSWVLPLPHNTLVSFIDFDTPVSKMINGAVFTDIDDEAATARYIGVGSNYEMHFNAPNQWIFFNALWGGDTKDILAIGNKASFLTDPEGVNTLHDDFATNNTCGGILHLNQKELGVFQSYVYAKDGFNLYLYGSIAWGDAINGWTSTTPDICVVDNSWEGHDQIRQGAGFVDGLYILEYNKNKNTIGMTLCQADPVVIPEKLFLIDSNGNQYAMEKWGDEYTTGDIAALAGTLGIVDENGKTYYTTELDPSYGYFPAENKHPWKVIYNYATKQITYQEGIWLSGESEDNVIAWIQCLPKNAKVYFFGQKGSIKNLINTAVFDQIDETNACARYIGVSSAYEVHYNAVNDWLFFNALWGGDTKDVLIIGNKAAFGADAGDYHLYDSFADYNTCGGILHLNQVELGVFRSVIYAEPGFNLYLYGSIAWGDAINGWTSTTPDVCVVDNSWEGHDQIRPAEGFVAGPYIIEYNKNANTISMVKYE